MTWECAHCMRPIQDCEQGILIADDDLTNWRVVHHISCDNDKGPWHPLTFFTGKRGARVFRNMERGGAFHALSPDALETLRALVVRESYDPNRVRRTEFTSWLRKQEQRDDPIGDLARDLARDQYYRLTNPGLNQIYNYLRSRGACDEALAALIEAYREWQSYGNTYRETRDRTPKPVIRRTPSRPVYQKKPIKERDGWLTLRFIILKRDGYKCCICGRSPSQDGVKLEVDHRIPRSKDGTDDPANLWTLCFDCNRGKGVRDL